VRKMKEAEEKVVLKLAFKCERVVRAHDCLNCDTFQTGLRARSYGVHPSQSGVLSTGQRSRACQNGHDVLLVLAARSASAERSLGLLSPPDESSHQLDLGMLSSGRNQAAHT
jgi:hypothetical protein